MLWNATQLIQHHDEIPTVDASALWVALAALVSKELLFRYMLMVAKEVKSSMLVANAWHARSDAASSLVVGLGILGNMAGYPLLDPIAALKAAIRPDTIVISVMFVNNEIGVIQDIPAIGAMCREKGIIFHVDAAQATGKVAIDLTTLPVDLMSLASHKTYGPKGIGALYVRRKPRVRLEAQMHGGGHERGMRSGTLPTHQCVGMGEAFRLARLEMAQDNAKARALHERLVNGLKDVEQVFLNGHATQRVPHNINMSFNFVEGESLIMGIKGLAVSSGSACTSASLEPSYVLRALGRSDELAHSSLRMTIGRWSTEEEIDFAIETIRANVHKLRELSPLWEMYQDGIDLSTIQWAAH
jgi:cysteine desulfurase